MNINQKNMLLLMYGLSFSENLKIKFDSPLDWCNSHYKGWYVYYQVRAYEREVCMHRVLLPRWRQKPFYNTYNQTRNFLNFNHIIKIQI